MRKSVTLVLGAVPWEIAPVCAALRGVKTGKIYDFPFWSGDIGGKPVVVAITGVGKSNAAMVSTLFIDRFKPIRLIYTGTAARVNRALNTGDIILSRKVVHHDFGTMQRTGMLYRKTIGPVKGRSWTIFAKRSAPTWSRWKDRPSGKSVMSCICRFS
jgi:nucleoside phosphorylase